MAKNNNLGDFLIDIANSIRAKTGGSSAINAQDFSTEIANIPTGKTMLDNTVVFDVQNNEYTIISVNSGNTIQEPTAPSISGYAFRGWYTQSGGSGSKITFPYTPLNDTTFYAYLTQSQSCTVTGLGSSSPSSVTFTKTSGFTVAGLGIQEITYNGDTFIKIPIMYRKVESVSSDQITSFTIANAKIDNSYEPYTCFIDENGNELPYILIGKYASSSPNSCNSVQTGFMYYTISNAREYARARGTGYQLYDWQIHRLWQDLIISISGTINVVSAAGSVEYDQLGLYWKYVTPYIDGIIFKEPNWYISYKPSEYVSLSGETTNLPSSYISVLSFTGTYTASSSGCVKKLGYDSNNPFANFIVDRTTSASYSSYYCDGFYLSTASNSKLITCNFAGFGASAGVAGPFYLESISNWDSSSRVIRLCYRPIT